MTKVLVSLVGDQTVPNVFLIRDTAFRQITHYVFVTTPQMEERQRLTHILAATGLKASSFTKTEVVADNPHHIRQQLEKLPILRQADHVYVNLTSGTKVMSIGLYDYFTRPAFAERSSIFYIPIGGNAFAQIFPEQAFQQRPITYRITLAEYLTSYGIKVMEQCNEQDLHQTANYTSSIFPHFLIDGTQKKAFAKMMETLRGRYNGKQQKPDFEIPLLPEMQPFLKQIAYHPSVEGALQKREIRYLTGGWLEEWTYLQVQQYLQLPTEYIRFQVKVGRNNPQGVEVPNEFDLMFTLQNTLYVVECKTGLRRDSIKAQFEESIYKLAALRMEFGQRVTAIFLTLSNLRDGKGQLRKPYANRASLHRIKLFDRKGMLEEFPIYLQELASG
ncbi:MAG: hypothetical protein DHS20C18_40840 [Saprospiraceae bacterium]|nr:MAG: hypothetical protein DHS20C18_40840 [Saprospiraceae bacterium]